MSGYFSQASAIAFRNSAAISTRSVTGRRAFSACSQSVAFCNGTGSDR